MGRSILAVILGYLATAIGTIATFGMLGAFLSPADFSRASVLVFLVGIGFVWAALGGWVAATVARRAEMKHALALGALMLVMGLVSMAMNVGKEPLWFQIAIIPISILGALAGGTWRARQAGRTTPAPAAT